MEECFLSTEAGATVLGREEDGSGRAVGDGVRAERAPDRRDPASCGAEPPVVASVRETRRQ